jgi:Opioid growth factor receptor (OGFr) conserved region
MNKPIVDFYSGKATDTSGRTLREIHAWSYHDLENVHDYIQWLFPLPEPSQYNQFAPVLDAEQITKFHKDAELRAELLASLDKMLEFYGFERNNMSIIRSITWEERSRNWLKSGNHNHLYGSHVS